MTEQKTHDWYYHHLAPSTTPITYSFVKDLPSIGLVDTSGSTQGDILEDEKRMIRRFQCQTHVSWNGYANIGHVDSFGYGGCTRPQCLYDVKDKILESSVVVFSTDGLIDAYEVEQFSCVSSQLFSHVSLLICIVTTSRTVHPPSMIDWSVFAPLLQFPNVIFLHLFRQDYKILRVSDGLKKQLLAEGMITLTEQLVDIDLTKTWNDLPSITPERILSWNLEVANPPTPLPLGYRLLSNGYAICLEKLLLKHLISLDTHEIDFLNKEFQSIALLAKNEGSILRVRSWVLEQEDEITREMYTLRSIDSNYLQNIVYIKYQSHLLLLQAWLSILSGFERATYSSQDMSMSLGNSIASTIVTV